MKNSTLSLGNRLQASLPGVLVVDSDPDNLHLFELIFCYLGFRVTLATSEDEALAMAAKAFPNLLAISLPPSIQECELIVAQLKSSAHFKAVPVLAVTTVADPERGEQLMEIGCNEFICKPFMLEDLAKIARRLAYPKSNKLAR